MAPPKFRKLALSVLGLGAATATVVFGSWASWSAQTTNPGNTVTAGTLTMSNSKTGATVWSTPFTSIKPGESGSDTVTITNTGSEAMSQVNLTQTGATDFTGDTQNTLQLSIYDQTETRCIWPTNTDGPCGGYGAWDASGTITNFPIKEGTAGGTTRVWAPAEAHTFLISWNFTNGGSADNDSQGDVASFNLTWDGVQ